MGTRAVAVIAIPASLLPAPQRWESASWTRRSPGGVHGVSSASTSPGMSARSIRERKACLTYFFNFEATRLSWSPQGRYTLFAGTRRAARQGWATGSRFATRGSRSTRGAPSAAASGMPTATPAPPRDPFLLYRLLDLLGDLPAEPPGPAPISPPCPAVVTAPASFSPERRSRRGLTFSGRCGHIPISAARASDQASWEPGGKSLCPPWELHRLVWAGPAGGVQAASRCPRGDSACMLPVGPT